MVPFKNHRLFLDSRISRKKSKYFYGHVEKRCSAEISVKRMRCFFLLQHNVTWESTLQFKVSRTTMFSRLSNTFVRKLQDLSNSSFRFAHAFFRLYDWGGGVRFLETIMTIEDIDRICSFRWAGASIGRSCCTKKRLALSHSRHFILSVFGSSNGIIHLRLIRPPKCHVRRVSFEVDLFKQFSTIMSRTGVKCVESNVILH